MYVLLSWSSHDFGDSSVFLGCVLLGIQRRITRGLILRCASRTSFWSWKVRIDVFGAFQRTSETNVEKLSG